MPRALQLEPERYGRLLEEITIPSASQSALEGGKSKENVELIRRLHIEKAERIKTN
jgi:hypothetical protein